MLKLSYRSICIILIYSACKSHRGCSCARIIRGKYGRMKSASVEKPCFYTIIYGSINLPIVPSSPYTGNRISYHMYFLCIWIRFANTFVSKCIRLTIMYYAVYILYCMDIMCEHKDSEPRVSFVRIKVLEKCMYTFEIRRF